MNKNQTIKIMLLSVLFFIFLTIIGFTYAYFSLVVEGKGKNITAKMNGRLKLVYTDGEELSIEDMSPGKSITKTVSIANINDENVIYSLVWESLENTVLNDELVIEIKCTRLNSIGNVEGKCSGLSSTPIKEKNIKSKIKIEPNITHKYDITITFVETGENQEYNIGATFSGIIGVEASSQKYATPVYCTVDGTLIQGAEYINGQYTYRYMQEIDINSDFDWKNTSTDGWGVVLTDRNSSDPITSEICSYINNKPVVSTIAMFANSKATKIDVSSFDTSNVTDMSAMFFNTSASEIVGLDYLNTSKVTSMYGMFYLTSSKSLNLSMFNTSNVINMYAMFAGANVTELDLSAFDTSKVIDMSYIFAMNKLSSLDLSNFDTSKVTSMSSMFFKTLFTTLDLSTFDTSNVTDMNSMFGDSSLLKTIYVSDKFNVSKVTESTNMFKGTTSLIGGAGYGYNTSCLDISCAKIDGENATGYFTRKNS